MTEEALVKRESTALALDNPEVQAMLEIIKTLPPQVVKVQSQTATWDFGNEVYKPKVQATILGDVRPRTWWEKENAGEGETARPDCYAPDGITPAKDSLKKQSETCASCPLSKFGSGKNDIGQACKQKTILVALEPDQVLPIAFRLPTTSTRAVDELYRGLFREQRLPSGVVTEFSLVKVTKGHTYSVAVIKPLRDVTEAEKAKIDAIKPYVQGFKDLLSGAARQGAADVEVPY